MWGRASGYGQVWVAPYGEKAGPVTVGKGCKERRGLDGGVVRVGGGRRQGHLPLRELLERRFVFG